MTPAERAKDWRERARLVHSDHARAWHTHDMDDWLQELGDILDEPLSWSEEPAAGELARLRAENAELRAQVADAKEAVRQESEISHMERRQLQAQYEALVDAVAKAKALESPPIMLQMFTVADQNAAHAAAMQRLGAEVARCFGGHDG